MRSSRPRTNPRGAASHYARWVASDPFDIGATTAASLGCLRHAAWAARAKDAGVDVAMTEAARERCMQSKANGSLMRATPLGVWGARRADARRDRRRAGRRAPLASEPRVRRCLRRVRPRHRLARPRAGRRRARARRSCARWARASACEEVRGWLDDADAGKHVPFTPQDGFVRIAFTHAFRHLRLGTPFVDALRETLAGGGDTDTNACIVGGLLGARWGAAAIPDGHEDGRARVRPCAADGTRARRPFIHAASPRRSGRCSAEPHENTGGSPVGAALYSG